MSIIFQQIINYTGNFKDKGSLNTPFVQATATNQASISTGVNGLPCLVFDGADNFCTATIGSDYANFSLVALLKINDTNDNPLITFATNTVKIILRDSTESNKVTWTDNNNAKTAISSAAIKTGVFITVSIVKSGTNIKLYVDDALEKETTLGAGASTIAGLSNLCYDGTNYASMSIQEIEMLTDVLSTTNVKDKNLYLRHAIYLPSNDGLIFLGGALAVGQWTDNSGNGNHLTGFNTPTVAAIGWNGRNVASGTGNEYYAKDGLNFTFPITIFATVSENYTVDHYLWALKTTDSYDKFIWYQHTSAQVGSISYWGADLSQKYIPFGVALPRNILTTMAIVINSDLSIRCYRSDLLGQEFVSTSNIRDFAGSSMSIYALTHVPGANNLIKAMQDYIIINRALSATEIFSKFRNLRQLRS